MFSDAVSSVMERGREGQIVAVGVNCTHPDYVEVSKIQFSRG